MYLTRVNYKDNNLNENKIVTTFKSVDELNVKMVNKTFESVDKLNVKMVN